MKTVQTLRLISVVFMIIYIYLFLKVANHIEHGYPILDSVAVSEVKPIALRTVKTLWSFDRSESNSLKQEMDGNNKRLEGVIAEQIQAKKKPILTLFTTWVDHPEKNLVHQLTIRNWASLRPYVIPVVFTNDSTVARQCQIQGWEVRSITATAADGVPILKYMYLDVMTSYETKFYAYSNSDILYTSSLIETLVPVVEKFAADIDKSHPLIIVGQRTNVDNVTEVDSSTWIRLCSVAKSRGTLFRQDAQDYFITTKAYPWRDIPPLVIGRRAYDNWLVYNALREDYIVIDATGTLLAVHQTTKEGNLENHKYGNNEYNHILLTDLYKKNVSQMYTEADLGCVENYTRYADGPAVVLRRIVPSRCSLAIGRQCKNGACLNAEENKPVLSFDVSQIQCIDE